MALIITLLVLGGILMSLETILPGMIASIVGFLCLTAALALGYRDFGFRSGNLVLVGIITGVFCWLKFCPESRTARLFISRSGDGDRCVTKPDLLHRTGVAITQLRPSGAAFINGKRVDVISEGGLIDRGAPLKVVAVEGVRVLVREV